ncbi:MAG: class I SAM-dependent DNA methyltransferase [Hominenteromicrobium sp.]|uniref:HsdM family class I SAM-dependent methyltransferase n=1 Tax=Hominenteromicrobium sp. TaxID=3073581 RepID=UPI0039927C80
MTKTQSVEPNIADLANGWLKSYKLNYKLEQESLNTEIDQALNDYYSKNGGVGGNRPDAKLLLQDKNLVNYPILIEYKGYKDKLVKLDSEGKVANKTAKNQPDFKNINSYAVNGAVHYANALLHYTSYTDIIAIGMTGFKDDSGNLEYEIGVYYVSKSNFGIGQKVDDYINKVENGESQLKRVFTKIVDDLGIYYKIGLTTDFTGKLFNEMYSWLGFSQDKLNDVVLTPAYVATLLARLARVNMDSYVWDFATGSAGLLVASMNEMLNDAKDKIKSPDKFAIKSAEIKANQLLGLEILSEVYMLAILNMILMGDGSSNILNKDSLKEFNGHYGFGKTDEKFPADAFVLNPPYSAPGNGMIFVEKALSMMSKGYAAIIIQNSAGSGKATEYNKKILKHSTLLASIKMPIDLFIGKSSVQTNVYVFRVGEAHQKDDTVKFIDFSVDGYTRTNRKKASCNLRDTDHAKERYQELVDLVRFGKSKLNIFTEKEYYEGKIDPNNGADWNQTAPIDTKPTLDDFKKTVSDYLAWEVSNLLKNQSTEDDRLGK